MVMNEFLKETEKIEKFYGKELEPFEKNIWFNALKTLSVKRYAEVIKTIFEQNKFMPKLADVIEANKSMPIATPKIQKTECKICKGNGFILYTKVINNGDRDIHYQYCARCTCSNGQNYLAYPSITEVNIK